MNLIFDFDGTICDSVNDSLTILNRFLVESGLKVTTKADFKAGGLKGLVEKGVLPADKIPGYVAFGVTEIATYIPHQKTFPGIDSVLKTLSRDHFMAIVTGNSKENVEVFLKNNNLGRIFKEIECDFEVFGKAAKIQEILKNHNLQPQETYYVGDESRDIDAANEARVKSIAVTWGLEEKDSLNKTNPDLIFDDPDDFLTLTSHG